jgi:hypothetical protein
MASDAVQGAGRTRLTNALRTGTGTDYAACGPGGGSGDRRCRAGRPARRRRAVGLLVL